MRSREKAIKRIFSLLSFCAPLLRLSSTSPPPRCSTKPHKQMQMDVKTLHRERAGPPFERGAEWALKETLINLSTAPIGPLGIFFTPLSEWEGRGGGWVRRGGGRRRRLEGQNKEKRKKGKERKERGDQASTFSIQGPASISPSMFNSNPPPPAGISQILLLLFLQLRSSTLHASCFRR